MSRKTTDYDRPNIKISLPRLIGVGLTAGLLGVAVWVFRLAIYTTLRGAYEQYDSRTED